jgi:hypothetical protein
MGVRFPLPAPSSFSLSHFLLVTYVRLECAAELSRADFGYKLRYSAHPIHFE